MKEKSFKTFKKISLAIMIVLGLYLLFVFPLSGDDFNRISQWFGGLDNLVKDYASTYFRLNGRLVGNFLSFFAMPKAIRIPVKAVFIGAIGYILAKIFGKKSTVFFYVFMLVFLPIGIFREVIVWNAGFFNYLPPVFLILISLYLLMDHKERRFDWIGLFFISLLGSLFVENISLYFLVLPILSYIIFRGEDKKKYLGSFIGALLGNIIMFSSPVYGRIAGREDSYRSMGLSNLTQTVENNWQVFTKNLIPTFMLIGLALIMICLILKSKNSFRTGPIVSLALIIALLVSKKLALNYLVEMALYIFLYISLLSIFISMSSMYGKIGIFASLSMAFAMAPLLVVSPVGNRNFFTPAVFNLMIILCLVYSIDLSLASRRLILALIILLSLFKLISYSYIYTVNFADYGRMLGEIEEGVIKGKGEIVIDGYTYEKYIHPDNGIKARDMFATKHDKGSNMEIIIE